MSSVSGKIGVPFRTGKPEIAVGKGFEMNALWVKRYFPKTLLKMAAKQYSKMIKANDLPLRISELRGLTVAHELGVTSNGNFNIATTMWLTHQSDLSRDSIVAELMICT